MILVPDVNPSKKGNPLHRYIGVFFIPLLVKNWIFEDFSKHFPKVFLSFLETSHASYISTRYRGVGWYKHFPTFQK